MQQKFLVNVVFVTAMVLAVFLCFTVSVVAEDRLNPSGQPDWADVYVTNIGQVLQMHKSPIQEEVVSITWSENGALARRHLLRMTEVGMELFSYYDGNQTWTLTPAEPIFRYSQNVGDAWEWQGTVTVGDSSYPGHMEYRIGPQTTVTIAENLVPVTQVLAYGRIGNQLIVRERLFSSELELIEENSVVSLHGVEQSNSTRLASLHTEG